MRRLFSILAMALAVACASMGVARPDLDAIAQDYVRLALEVGEHEDGYIDAYYGPPQWKEAAHANPRSVAGLQAEADRLLLALQGIHHASLSPLEQRRRHFLMAHIASARFRLDMIDGERATFASEANRLFGVAPEIRPLSSYDSTLARIDAMVPGAGPLSERVQAFRDRYTIPRDKLDAVMRAAIAECRRRTAAHMRLPDGEAFTLEFVTNQPWSGYNWYQGGAQSLIQINTDFPIYIDRAVDLGCHEGYPGHHTHHSLMEEHLVQRRGWVEYSVYPLFSPLSFIAEGEGNFGIDLAFPGDERLRFEAETLYPLAGLDPTTAPAYAALREALKELAGARITIAEMYLDGAVGRVRAIELLQQYRLESRARPEQSLAFIERYRAYVINYGPGEDAVRAYIMRAGDATARWAAMAQLLSEPSLPARLRGAP